jgi:hypothetical protein
MSKMENVISEIQKVVDQLQGEGIAIQVKSDSESGIIRIYGEGSDALKRAVSGMNEVSELAYTTAEHHPYWTVLYHAAEICRVTLEKWNGELSAEELGEIEWRIGEIRSTLERLKRGGHGLH